jgi:protein ImuB
LFDRALGRSPDPRLGFLPEERFSRRCELAYPLHEVARLMPLLERMIPDLIDWGWRTAQVLTRIALILGHEGMAATRLEIGFAGTRNPLHLRLIIGEHLDRLVVPSAVVEFQLEILNAETADATSGDLLPAPPARLRKGQELLERLRARLGREAVHGLALYPDHRPELAWRFVEPGTRTNDGEYGISPAGQPQTAGDPHPPVQYRPGPRPLWLLERPRDLGVEAVPYLGGPLRLVAGPERIEGGWWDGRDVARDYFVAAGPDGPQYWIYRERRGEARWFLQGLFA